MRRGKYTRKQKRNREWAVWWDEARTDADVFPRAKSLVRSKQAGKGDTTGKEPRGGCEELVTYIVPLVQSCWMWCRCSVGGRTGGGGAGWTECMQEGGRREAGEERLRRPQIAEGETEEEEKKQRGSVRGRAKYEVGGERASCHGEGVVSPVTHSRGKAKDVSNAEDEALLYVHTVAGMYEYYVCLVYCM